MELFCGILYATVVHKQALLMSELGPDDVGLGIMCLKVSFVCILCLLL